MKKAFDTVDYEILVDSLHQLGLREVVKTLIKDYLSHRTVGTYVNEITSQAAAVTREEPQGLVLGPLLYIPYINNMQKLHLTVSYTVFGDDTVILYTGNTKEDLETEIVCDMQLLGNWLKECMLTLNVQ